MNHLRKQIEISNIVANSILYKLEQYFELPDEATMIATLLDPCSKSSIFTTEETTRTIAAIKRKLQLKFDNNRSTITTDNQTSSSQIIKNRVFFSFYYKIKFLNLI